MPLLTGEPAAVVGAILTALNAIQVAAIPMPTWAHTLIVAVSTVLGALVVRQVVTPSGRVEDSVIAHPFELEPHEQFRVNDRDQLPLAAALKDSSRPSSASRRLGFDYAWGDLSARAVKSAGGSFVCGYISHDPAKDLTLPEVQAFSAAGVDVVCVFESTPGRALEGYDAGREDAKHALARMRALNAPPWVAIYYAIDTDVTPSEQTAVNAYFRGVGDEHRRQRRFGIRHRVGAYGGFWPIKRLFDLKLIDRGWQTYAWSGGMWDWRAKLRQWRNAQRVGGVSVDFDWGLGTRFGQWRVGQKPGPVPKPRPLPKPGPFHGIVREGMHGTHVRQIQHWLNLERHAGLVEDGIFGPKTLAAVKAFQRAHHHAGSGVVDQRTWAALFNDKPKKKEHA